MQDIFERVAAYGALTPQELQQIRQAGKAAGATWLHNLATLAQEGEVAPPTNGSAGQAVAGIINDLALAESILDGSEYVPITAREYNMSNRPLCKAMTLSGKPCANLALANGYCGIMRHQAQYAASHSGNGHDEPAVCGRPSKESERRVLAGLPATTSTPPPAAPEPVAIPQPSDGLVPLGYVSRREDGAGALESVIRGALTDKTMVALATAVYAGGRKQDLPKFGKFQFVQAVRPDLLGKCQRVYLSGGGSVASSRILYALPA